MRVSSDMPDDVIVLHDALQKIRELYGTPKEYASYPSLSPCAGEELCSIGLPVAVRRTTRGGVSYSPQKLRYRPPLPPSPHRQMLSRRTDYAYRRSATHGT